MTTPRGSQPQDRPSARGTTPLMQSLKLLTIGISGGIVMMAIALAFVLTFSAPPLWAVALLLALGLVAHGAITTVGYRAAPIPAGTPATEATARASGVFRSLMMLRMAIAESVALVAIVLSFVVEGRSWLVFAVGAAVSLLLLGLHVWPSRTILDKVDAALTKEGVPTGLRELLGFGGGIQDIEQPPGFQQF